MMRPGRNLTNPRGLTLIELLIVMSIFGILMGIAIPSYKRSQIKARETVLAEDLYEMRRAIDAYYVDYKKYPDNLEALVAGKYMRGMPRDPFTFATDSWQCLPPEPAEDGEQAEGGCFDVVSGSDVVGLNNIPYNQW